MRPQVLALLAVTALLLVSLLGAGAPPVAEGCLPGFDPKKPDSWTASVDRTRGELRQTAKALEAVALDPKRPDDDRRQAILALGKIGNWESLEFLVNHVELNIPTGTIKEAGVPGNVCYYVLLNQGTRWRERNLNIIGAILEALDTPRTETELSHYASIFRELLSGNEATKGRASMFIKYELKTHPPTVRRINLEEIRKFLKSEE